jgi:hypothetical protein
LANCNDARLEGIFLAVLEYSDQEDLGLGSSHRVEHPTAYGALGEFRAWHLDRVRQQLRERKPE